MNVCIKGIREKDWRLIKSEAAKADLNIGEYIVSLASKPRTTWDDLLKHKPVLSEEEANELSNHVEKVRNEFSFER
jgi:hypothetical protein